MCFAGETGAPPLLSGDYHLHTALCGHAVGSMEAYVRQAVESGLNEVGFSDHLPLGPDRKKGHTMALFEMETYVEELTGLRERYPQLRILIGGEIGLYQGVEEDLRELLERFPLDHVIGSVHYFSDSFVFGDQVYKWSRQKRLHEISACFDLYRTGVASGLVTIIGHLDAVKCLFPEEEDAIAEGADTVLVDASNRGTVLELNTSGLRKSAGGMFPSLPLLRAARDRGVSVCTGSDAHTPDQVGSAFPEARALLGAAGYAERTVRKNGLLVYHPA